MKYRATRNYRKAVRKGEIVTLEPSEQPGILNIVNDSGWILSTISRKNPMLFTFFVEVLEECEPEDEDDFRLWYCNYCDEANLRDDDDIPVQRVHRQHPTAYLVW